MSVQEKDFNSGLEQQLIESEDRYRLLFDANPLPMWVYDLDNLSFLAINSATVDHYGYSRDEFLSMTLKDIRPPQDVPALIEKIAEIDAHDYDVSTWKHQTKDGTLIDVEITGHKLEFLGKRAAIVLAVDITERKRAESEIFLQKARFQQLFENSPMAILMIDTNDTILDANKQFESMFQYSLDEIHGRLLSETLVPASLKEEGADLSSRAFHGQLVKKETVRKGRDGSLIPVQIHAVPIVANNEMAGIFAIYEDLREQKRTELEREVVLEIIQGAVSTSDLKTLFELIHRSISRILYAENCFIALHDAEADMMEFSFWVDKFDPAPAPLPLSVGFSSYVLRTGKPLLLTRELTEQMIARGETTRSGTSSPSWLGVPLRTPSRTVGVLVVQHYEDEHAYVERDLEFLTSVASQIAMAIERKQAEQALLEANDRALREYERLVERIAAMGQTLGNARDLTVIFRALRDFAVSSVPVDGMVISLYDRDKQARRPAYCWTDEKEFDPNELAAAPVGDGLTGRAIKSGSVVIDNDFRKGLMKFENRIKIGECPDDEWPRSALSAPMTVMGRTVGCVEIQSYREEAYQEEHATAMRMAANLAANAVENVNLIERERVQEGQFRQAQKMESIGTLAGGIAHDFNNLMTAVTGYSELTLRSLPADHAVRPKIEEIKKAGERAAALTRQLLAFSRKQMLQPTVLDLNSVVKGIGQMLPRLIGEDIDLRIALARELGQIKADRSQLEQVVLNLGVNARDAMPGGGTLTIRTENVRLDGNLSPQQALSPGRYVMLTVSDTGCGMDDDTQAHIFEPFFTTKEVGKGTGLGLSTVYGIVKQSGGAVWVYSEIGKGTSFKIYLPRVDEPTMSEELEEASPEVSRGHETVLLVEDEDVVRRLSQEILEGRGYRVLSAANGKEGLKICQDFKEQIDLVVTDVIMPIMGGREMADRIAILRPETKVLYMSGFTDDAIVHHGVLEDGVFFIEKPFSPDSLALKVREVLDSVAG